MIGAVCAVGHAPTKRNPHHHPQDPQKSKRCRLANNHIILSTITDNSCKCKNIPYNRHINNPQEYCMKSTQAQRQELYQLIDLARAQRAKTARAEELIGNVLFSVLGACVLFTIVLWLTR